MVVQPLYVKNDSFRPRENGENLPGPEVAYLSDIDALMSLTNCIVQILIFLSKY